MVTVLGHIYMWALHLAHLCQNIRAVYFIYVALYPTTMMKSISVRRGISSHYYNIKRVSIHVCLELAVGLADSTSGKYWW